MSLFEARIGVVVSCPQVSSLYEALTWGLIHLRLFEPLAPSVLTMRAVFSPVGAMEFRQG